MRECLLYEGHWIIHGGPTKPNIMKYERLLWQFQRNFKECLWPRAQTLGTQQNQSMSLSFLWKRSPKPKSGHTWWKHLPTHHWGCVSFLERFPDCLENTSHLISPKWLFLPCLHCFSCVMTGIPLNLVNDWRIEVSREEEEGKEEGENNEGGGVEEEKESWACFFYLLLGKIPQVHLDHMTACSIPPLLLSLSVPLRIEHRASCLWAITPGLMVS